MPSTGSCFDDPKGRFKRLEGPNVARAYVSPSDLDDVKYAVQVLESCYDHSSGR